MILHLLARRIGAVIPARLTRNFLRRKRSNQSVTTGTLTYSRSYSRVNGTIIQTDIFELVMQVEAARSLGEERVRLVIQSGLRQVMEGKDLDVIRFGSQEENIVWVQYISHAI